MDKKLNEDKPLVTVIVPSYNHEQYITQCIESIVHQTYKNFELLVIDDGSKDNSPEILKQLQDKYGFNLILQENVGLVKTLNTGIQKSNGKYIAPCASDDYWLLDKLEKQVDFMEQHPEFPMSFGKSYVVDQYGKAMPNLTAMANKPLKGGYVFKEIILQEFNPPVNFLYRKSIFSDVGNFKNTRGEDFQMNLKIAQKYPLGFINDYLGYYRTTASNKAVHKTKFVDRKIYPSHLESINEYKNSEYYNEAVKMWHLRCFYSYSRYPETKKEAFIGMIKNIDKFYKIRFLKSVIKLILLWK